MTRKAHFDMASGASGDMIIASLADAGRKLGTDVSGAVTEAISSLELACAVTFVDDERGGLACLRAEVKTDATRYTPAQLRAALERPDVSDAARRRALDGLDALVHAESVVHGTDMSEVHLHELGSADTAADLIGAAVGFETLGVTDVSAAPVPVPAGWIQTEHGRLPLPAPVTLELLSGALIRGVDDDVELVTPSGATILVAHNARFGAVPEMTLLATGIGGGTRKTDRPNICRVLVGAAAGNSNTRLETTVVLETNIDDQTPEAIGYAVEKLILDGALDAWVVPILMKKTRPAFLLSVLVRPEEESRITESIFRHTTTLGVRRRETTRWALERSVVIARVAGREIRVKVARMGSEVFNVAPEFQDCVDAAEGEGVPVKDVYDEATRIAWLSIGETH